MLARITNPSDVLDLWIYENSGKPWWKRKAVIVIDANAYIITEIGDVSRLFGKFEVESNDLIPLKDYIICYG